METLETTRIPCFPFVTGHASFTFPGGGPRGSGPCFSWMSRVSDIRPIVNDHSSPLFSLPSYFTPVCFSKFISWWWRFISPGITEIFGIPFKTWIFSSCSRTCFFPITLTNKAFSPIVYPKQRTKVLRSTYLALFFLTLFT